MMYVNLSFYMFGDQQNIPVHEEFGRQDKINTKKFGSHTYCICIILQYNINYVKPLFKLVKV